MRLKFIVLPSLGFANGYFHAGFPVSIIYVFLVFLKLIACTVQLLATQSERKMSLVKYRGSRGKVILTLLLRT